MRRISSEWIFDGAERRVGNYEGKPVPDDQVANEGKRNIGSAGSGFGSVQHGSRSSKALHRILDIKWEGDGVPEGIGTFLVGSRCLVDPFLVQKCFV